MLTSFILLTLSVKSLQSPPFTYQSHILEPDHKEELTEKISGQEKISAVFPASNALTDVDAKYFAMIRTEWTGSANISSKQDEVPWLDQLKQMPKVRIDSHGFPESFALTETDREYFNIIKTEDGTSDFIRSPVDKTLSRKDERSKNLDKTQGQEHIQENNNGEEVASHQHRTPSFRYHLVSTNSSRPIVGIYLPEGSN